MSQETVSQGQESKTGVPRSQNWCGDFWASSDPTPWRKVARLGMVWQYMAQHCAMRCGQICSSEGSKHNVDTDRIAASYLPAACLAGLSAAHRRRRRRQCCQQNTLAANSSTEEPHGCSRSVARNLTVLVTEGEAESA